MPLHPDCLGLFDTDGTVESYLESQGTRPYFEHDRIYSAAYKKIMEGLSAKQPPGKLPDHAVWPETGGRDPSASAGLLSNWLDVDAAVASYCRSRNQTEPQKPSETISLHIRALEEWIAGL